MTSVLSCLNLLFFVLYCNVLLMLPNIIQCQQKVSFARGFGDHINWQLLEDGLESARQSRKPIMALFHKSWCGACKSLAPKVANSELLGQLSKHFVMINVYDEEEPHDPKYTPDGGYIPRILFMNPDGEIHTEIYNEGGSAEHKYFYYEPKSIARAMKHTMVLYEAQREL